MRVLVTGATGFIGLRLVQRLLGQGHAVTALSRSASERVASGADVVLADLRHLEVSQLGSAPFDRVFHLAAMVSFEQRARSELLAVNGEGTRHLLALAREWNGCRSVVVSSACTLGISSRPEDILDETSVPSERVVRRNPYLESKLAAERAALWASRSQSVVVANPTTVYGPGDWSLNSGTLVRQVLGSRVVPVPPGGSNVVDVDDVVDGLLAAAEHGRTGRRYVLGGCNLRFGEIVDTICEQAAVRRLRVPLPRGLMPALSGAAVVAGPLGGGRFLTPQIVGDLFYFKYYSSARAERELGWKARYPFAETIERALSFYRHEGLLP